MYRFEMTEKVYKFVNKSQEARNVLTFWIWHQRSNTGTWWETGWEFDVENCYRSVEDREATIKKNKVVNYNILL